jgi:hypothetical protein
MPLKGPLDHSLRPVSCQDQVSSFGQQHWGKERGKLDVSSYRRPKGNPRPANHGSLEPEPKQPFPPFQAPSCGVGRIWKSLPSAYELNLLSFEQLFCLGLLLPPTLCYLLTFSLLC